MAWLYVSLLLTTICSSWLEHAWTCARLHSRHCLTNRFRLKATSAFRSISSQQACLSRIEPIGWSQLWKTYKPTAIAIKRPQKLGNLVWVEYFTSLRLPFCAPAARRKEKAVQLALFPSSFLVGRTKRFLFVCLFLLERASLTKGDRSLEGGQQGSWNKARASARND